MVPFGWRIVVNACALWIIDGLWDSIRVVPADRSVVESALFFLILGLLVALVNAVVKPVVKFFSFPLYILTLGLFALVVNAGMLELVAAITRRTSVSFEIDSFGSAVGAGLALAVLTALMSIPFKRSPGGQDGSRRDRR
jgi:putative membrane protein